MIIDASKIREARHAKGWTQQQLGDVSMLSLRTIQRIESQGQGSLETCNALCAVLELQRADILVQTSAKQAGPRAISLRVLFITLLAGFTGGVVFTLLLTYFA
ncbi:XRE family transcriptional regulator [Aliidiomarina shirensis]|uniref:XRE family transcriptional regulator n=1 Tax=Aliidiomarina shirensis TaxID=1048642 RepID=A0A432WNU2_9GAMM|nr:helix-turn-helix transcriptional regulator [Aliidiomarina shirensis]RUO35472.1 XRE family transcriptional regulator [Aliidiomarina shirensis]